MRTALVSCLRKLFGMDPRKKKHGAAIPFEPTGWMNAFTAALVCGNLAHTIVRSSLVPPVAINAPSSSSSEASNDTVEAWLKGGSSTEWLYFITELAQSIVEAAKEKAGVDDWQLVPESSSLLGEWQLPKMDVEKNTVSWHYGLNRLASSIANLVAIESLQNEQIHDQMFNAPSADDLLAFGVQSADEIKLCVDYKSKQYVDFIPALRKLLSIDDKLALVDLPLRTIVMAYQVAAGGWIRNGQQVLSEHMNYVGPPRCRHFYDLDLLALQCFLPLLDKRHALLLLSQRYASLPCVS